jgi:hypothetical protein
VSEFDIARAYDKMTKELSAAGLYITVHEDCGWCAIHKIAGESGEIARLESVSAAAAFALGYQWGKLA